MPEKVQLWRCSQCGQWSFAKSKPRRHRRANRDASDRFAPLYVGCGPFEGWTATKDET